MRSNHSNIKIRRRMILIRIKVRQKSSQPFHLPSFDLSSDVAVAETINYANGRSHSTNPNDPWMASRFVVSIIYIYIYRAPSRSGGIDIRRILAAVRDEDRGESVARRQGGYWDARQRTKDRQRWRGEAVERGGEVGRRVHPPQIDWNCSPGWYLVPAGSWQPQIDVGCTLRQTRGTTSGWIALS